MQISTTREQGESHGLKILVHGPAGSGKTVLCSTTPDHSKTLILSAEAGLLSIRQHNIAVGVLDTVDDLIKAYKHLKAQTEGKAPTGAFGGPYEWVCIDSLSEIAELVLANELEANSDGRKAYGEMATRMFKIIRSYRDLPGINIIFTAKQTRIEDEGRLVYAPMFPGKQITQQIPYLFDEVFAMRTMEKDGQVHHFLQTINDGRFEAKDRSGSLNPKEKPNLTAIYNKIMGISDDA